jgi:DNA-binding SARP family transcriptional activator/tetratricopeptide (TPR) repeat protein
VDLVGGVVEFRLLGPVEIEAEGQVLDVGPPQQQLVVAALALDAGRQVTMESLINRVWDEAPGGARRTLQVLITRARRLLERADSGGGAPVEVLRRCGGYILQLDPDRVDAHRFRRLVGQARDPNRPDGQRVELLRDALTLWRGEPLAGLPGQWATRTRDSWRQQYLDAAVAWAQAELRVGNPAAVIGPLSELAGEHPLVESLAAVLMRALHAAGRPADALGHYTTIRHHLVDALGTDPSTELQAVYQAILRGKLDTLLDGTGPPEKASGTGAAGQKECQAIMHGEPDPPQTTNPSATAVVKVVRSLRADIATFTGRGDQIQEIIQAISTPDGAAGGMVAIHAIDGMPGVGKTALAVHVAHQVADRFPDGQLFVDLHAHSADRGPADPADILAVLLSATGMAAEQIPAGLAERAARWRDRMARKRLLLVLDNAASDGQVAPLLPGSAGCLVLVTSRRRLAGLRRDYGATIVPLGVLPEPDAVALFTRVFPHALSGEDEKVVVGVVRLCGYLPLAITILAAGVDTGEHTTVDDLRTDLENTQDRLAGIDDHLDDQELGVAAAFDLSYQRLSSEHQRVLRLLSLTPGADIDPYAAAALTDQSLTEVRRTLRTLCNHRLIDQPTHHRYRLHDLVAAYLRTRTTTGERDQACGRLLDYYQHTAAAADIRLFRRGAGRTRTPRPKPTTPVPEVTEQTRATEWLRVERANLLTCLQHTRRHHQRTRLVDLTASLATLLRRDGPWTEGIDLHTYALTICQEIGDRGGEAWTLGELGALRRMTDDYPEADSLLEQALTICREIGDRGGEAWTLGELGTLRRATSDYAQATAFQEKAMSIFRELDDRNGEAWALGELGALRRATGDYAQATGLGEQAMSIFGELGDRGGEAWALCELGALWRAIGDYRRATGLLEQAMTIFRELGDRGSEAWTLGELGALRRVTGDYPRAIGLLEQAVTTCREIGDRHGEARVFCELGALRRATGDYPRATGLLERALSIFRDLGDRRGEAWALGELGALRRATGAYPQAAGLLEQALSIFQEIGDRSGEGWALGELGALRRVTGDYPRAVGLLEQAVTICREIGDRHGEARTLGELGALRRATGHYPQAAGLLQQALSIFQEIGDRHGEEEILNHHGALLLSSGDPQRTCEHRQALELARGAEYL